MGKRIGKLIDKMLIGGEKSEDFARSTLPSNRWELFWDIFKGSFGKLILINLLILLFFIPTILLIYSRKLVQENYGAMYPFAQVFGVGYQAPINVQGFMESIAYNANMIVFLLLPLVIIIAAIGISGGAYTIRNMVWTEGVFVANDFWKGIKQNYKQIVVISLLFSIVFYITTMSSSLAQFKISEGGQMVWVYYILEILSYLILSYYSLMTLHMITLSVTYELKVVQIIRNSFYFVLAFLPQSLFFAIIAILPFALIFLSVSAELLLILVIIADILIGFSFAFLVWTNFAQWSFDNFINDRVPGAKKNRGIYEKYKAPSNQKTILDYKVITRNSLNSRPIKPITDEEIQLMELPQSFSREDLEKLNKNKEEIYADNRRYIEEHKNDERYKLTEEEQRLIDEQKAHAKKIEKAKKALKKHQKYNK